MHLEYEHAAASGLRRYVSAVAEELGCSGEAYYAHLDPPPAYAYLALDDRLPDHPGQDTALVWNEHDGWAVAIETTAGHELSVVRYLGAELLPPPPEVARFVDEVFAGRAPDAAPAGTTDGAKVRQHLATYAIPYQERPTERPGRPVEQARRRPAR
ncbi:DUF6292 family protein [Amycolatopsis thermalba]|uniref:DUF6292 family protein n=1 Tax=Amycolatopsis thermalba TaxID=944492 RepID=A0ABY4NWC4_9PSEU|nr:MULTISPECIES: DUF6292 family protein [Amycolatopsis]OXM67479.1 hypothetical protein CF166_23990 [Amycolatopsis sp. KNN50.9b]UQS24379.1 DUF6292 family protein [Amycolatopsis thermalba]